MKLDIAAMDQSALADVLDWAADEGWNPGLADAAAFHAADPDGFFLARVDGQAVAAISVVNHDADHAFLGLYLCHPDWRGQGIGLATWTHALAHAGERCVGLDGVPAQEANYHASGFVREGATLRHVGQWPPAQNADIHSFEAADLDSLAALDKAANGYARPHFLNAWLSSENGLRATRVLEHSGTPIGFATWRACREGTKIGPIIAPDLHAAQALISDIAAFRPNGPLIIDVPDTNSSLCEALKAQAFEVPFSTARMYRGTPPKTGPHLQAIATMELG